MTNPEHEELLSAYLDGELSPAERATVERLLAEQPELRQLQAELQAQAALVRSLPRERLEAGFAQQVMAKVDQHKPQAAATVASHTDSSARLHDRGPVGWQRLVRPVFWSTLTLATAILLMTLAPDSVDSLRRSDNAEREVAMSRSTAYEELQMHAPESGEAGGPEQRAAGAPESGNLAVDERDEFSGAGAAGAVAGAMMAKSADRGAASAAAAPANSVDEAAANGARNLGFALINSQSAIDLAGQFRDDGVLLVECDLTSEAASSNAFGRLLASNQIDVEQAIPESKLSEEPAAATEEIPARIEAAAPSSSASTDATADAGPAAAADAQLVVVEATPSQLEATLSQLQAQSGQFVNVRVMPAANVPAQQRFLNYNRIDVRSTYLALEPVQLLNEPADADRPADAAASAPAATPPGLDVTAQPAPATPPSTEAAAAPLADGKDDAATETHEQAVPALGDVSQEVAVEVLNQLPLASQQQLQEQLTRWQNEPAEGEALPAAEPQPEGVTKSRAVYIPTAKPATDAQYDSLAIQRQLSRNVAAGEEAQHGDAPAQSRKRNRYTRGRGNQNPAAADREAGAPQAELTLERAVFFLRVVPNESPAEVSPPVPAAQPVPTDSPQ